MNHEQCLTDWRELHGDFFENTRVLITGGAGFIGSHLTEALVQLGARVTVIDDLSTSSRGNLQFPHLAGELDFVEASILDPHALARCAEGCRYIFHQAARVSVPQSIDDPQTYYQVNVTGTFNVIEAGRAAGAQRLMFAASSAAYGDSEILPKTEDMPTEPVSPYAASKVAAEAMLHACAASYPLDTAPLRYFNVFGSRQNANSAYAAVIAAFAHAIANHQRPQIFGDGKQSRDFTHVHNVVHANLLAARADTRIAGRPINVATGQRVSVNELAAQMLRMLGKPELAPEHQPPRAGDVMHSLANLTRARELIDYKPIVCFQRGLADTLNWYAREHVPS